MATEEKKRSSICSGSGGPNCKCRACSFDRGMARIVAGREEEERRMKEEERYEQRGKTHSSSLA